MLEIYVNLDTYDNFFQNWLLQGKEGKWGPQRKEGAQIDNRFYSLIFLDNGLYSLIFLDNGLYGLIFLDNGL